MRKSLIILKELQSLYREFWNIDFKSYLDFANLSRDLLFDLKIELSHNFVTRNEINFEKYRTEVISQLNNFKYDKEKCKNANIKDWYLKYNYKYNLKELKSNPIPQFDPESSIYSDLSKTVNSDIMMYSYDIVKLQTDFLNYTKIIVLKEIINWFKKMNRPVSNNLQKSKKQLSFKEYFGDRLNISKVKKLKKIFNQTGSKKDFAIMTCLLTQSKLVYINSKGRKDFYKSWYQFNNLEFDQKEKFNAINKHILSSNKRLIFKNESDSDYLILKNLFEIEIIF